MKAPAPPGSAGQPTRTAWRNPVVAAVLLVALLGGALWWWQAPAHRAAPLTTSAASADSYDRLDVRAAAAVAALDAAWDGHTRARFLDAAGSAATSRAWAHMTYRNLRLLHATDVDWRYVASHPITPSSSGAPGSFDAEVEVQWTPGRGSGLIPHPTNAVSVTMRLVVEREQVSIVGVAARSREALPLWLAGPLHLLTLRGATCVRVGDGGLARIADLTRHALGEVKNVVGTPGHVTVVVPPAARKAAEILGSSTAGMASVAAVTMTVDGSSSLRAPVQVVLVPPAFEELDDIAAQVVLTHEVTHATTGATASSMPLWVAEGFADFVALRDGSVEPDQAAGQLLRHVRRHGPPLRLPGPADFAGSAPRRSSSYEAAWLVFRLLAERYGDAATVSFYEHVADGSPLRPTLRSAFDLGVPQLTQAWRNYLDRLATA